MPPAPSQLHPPLQAADVLRGACNIWPQYLHCTLLRVTSSRKTKPQLVHDITEFCSEYGKTVAADTEVAQFVLTRLSYIGRGNGDLFVANISAPEPFLNFSQSLRLHLLSRNGYKCTISDPPHFTFAKKKYEEEPCTNWQSWLPHLLSNPVFMEPSSVLQPTQVCECFHEF